MVRNSQSNILHSTFCALHSALCSLRSALCNRGPSVLLLGLALAPIVHAQQRPLKVYISADMEGVTGAVTRDQVGSGGAEYERFREIMTDEVNAAIDGALAAGATDIVVSDSHGSGQNILVDRLRPEARLVRSFPRPLDMMQGIDESFDAVFFIGYHAAQGRDAVMAHTMNGAVAEIALNGTPVGEGGFNAAIAGHFGVPVVLVSGDQHTVGEIRSLLGAVEGVAVKEALGGRAALSLHPTTTQQMIRAAATAALRRLDDFRPYHVSVPVAVRVAFKHTVHAELGAMIPTVERLDGNVIRLRAKDMVEASKFVVLIMHLSPPN